MNVQINKEKYGELRAIEKETRKKVDDLILVVPDRVNDVWGAYQVKRCYQLGDKYFAQMTLIKAANDEKDAEIKVLNFMNRYQSTI